MSCRCTYADARAASTGFVGCRGCADRWAPADVDGRGAIVAGSRTGTRAIEGVGSPAGVIGICTLSVKAVRTLAWRVRLIRSARPVIPNRLVGFKGGQGWHLLRAAYQPTRHASVYAFTLCRCRLPSRRSNAFNGARTRSAPSTIAPRPSTSAGAQRSAHPAQQNPSTQRVVA